MHQLTEAMVRAQLRHPRRFLLTALGVTLVCSILAAGLVFDSRYEALLPPNEPRLAVAQQVRQHTGGVRQLVIAIGGEDEQSRLEFGRELIHKLKKIKQIRHIDLEFPIDFFKDRAAWLMPQEKLNDLVPALSEAVRIAKWQANPMHLHLDEEAEQKELEEAWQKVDAIIDQGSESTLPGDGVLTSRDGRYTFILAIPGIEILDLEAGRRMIADIEAAATALSPQSKGIEVRLAGPLMVLLEQQATMLNDLRTASILALVFGVCIVAGFTRRALGPLLIGLSLICGVSWTFALTRLFIGHVNVITGFLVAVLFGLGIDFGIHLFIRYQQARRHGGRSADGALADAVKGTLPPAMTSALTTAGTFLTFVVADFRGFSEFGLIAGIGVLLTLTSAFVVLPPLLLLIDRRRDQSRNRAAGQPTRLSTTFTQGTEAPRWVPGIVVLVFVAMAGFGGFAADKIPFRNNFGLLRGESPASEFFRYVDENLGAGFNPAVVLTDRADHAARVAALARQLSEQPHTDGTPSLIGRVLTITDLIPQEIENHRQKISELKGILEDPKLDRAEKKGGKRGEQLKQARRMAQAIPWTIDEIPQAFARRLLSTDRQKYVVFIWPKNRIDADYWLISWEDELLSLADKLDQEGIDHLLADETLVAGWIHRLIVADSPSLLALAAAVLLIFLIIDFRRLRDVALVATPLIIGMLTLIGVMRWLGLELNMFNLVVLPSIIGIGVDNAVHIFHRYRTEGPGSLRRVVRFTGAAALLASMTTGVGFGSSMISHHLGLRTLGSLAVLGIGATFCAAVIFFPAFLALLEQRGKGSP